MTSGATSSDTKALPGLRHASRATGTIVGVAAWAGMPPVAKALAAVIVAVTMATARSRDQG